MDHDHHLGVSGLNKMKKFKPRRKAREPRLDIRYSNLCSVCLVAIDRQQKLLSGQAYPNRWHGVRHIRTAWADGPGFITQCSIRLGKSCTYRFIISGQVGTLWWHAHNSWLKATIYGALIIRQRQGDSYSFPKPNRVSVIILGFAHDLAKCTSKS
nr:laccase 12 [Tanacetum cinerariifolium]